VNRGADTGTAPSLMGFGDEDRFVVITDGRRVMSMDPVLARRDSRRLAAASRRSVAAHRRPASGQHG